MTGNDNRALVDYALKLRAALMRANADKAALREWARLAGNMERLP